MRFFRYADGSEERYGLETDPNEWDNLLARRSSESQGRSGDPGYAKRLEAFGAQVGALQP